MPYRQCGGEFARGVRIELRLPDGARFAATSVEDFPRVDAQWVHGVLLSSRFRGAIAIHDAILCWQFAGAFDFCPCAARGICALAARRVCACGSTRLVFAISGRDGTPSMFTFSGRDTHLSRGYVFAISGPSLWVGMRIDSGT
jgi:hypothetical protein